MRVISKVLVANRGQIAIRAFRAAYQLGIATMAVPRWGETRCDGWDGRLIVTCGFETREATGYGDRLAHNREVPLPLSRGTTEPTMAIVVPKAPGEPQRRDD